MSSNATKAAAALLGRNGGLSRAKKLSKARRRAIAQMGGKARWQKKALTSTYR